MKNIMARRHRHIHTKLVVAVAFAIWLGGAAHAFVIDTGNPDIDMRWDNSIRYNAGMRMEGLNPDFANSFGNDETENSVKKHRMVTNRVDLLSELEFVYKRDYGARVSAALWSEQAYSSHVKTSPLIDSTYGGTVPANMSASKTYSAYAKRYLTGDSGEILDAFVFGAVDLGPTTLRLKAGQHNIYWGESLYTVGDGIATGQGPIDTIKAATSPGAEAKELFMPLKQVSGQWQLSSTLSLSAQYLLDWKPFRLVPGGTYFAVGSSADGVSAACGRVLPPAFGAGSCMRFLEDITPGRSGGDFGVALRWTPDWLDGTAGFYYRKYDEKMPWSATQYGGGSPNLLANTGVRMNYARNTELFGFSLAKSIGGISVGAELSYRHNTALNSVNGYFIGTGGDTPVTAASFGAMLPNIAVPLAQTPGYSAAEGARGNTMHAVLNGIWLMPRTPLWKTGTLQAELTYQRLDSVTRNSNLFYSDSYACKFGYGAAGIAPGSRGKKDGCATRDAWGFALGFTPEWPQAFAGWDLSLPISFSIGLKGNSPAIGGVNEGVYKYAIGVKGKYRSQHEFGLTWMDSYAHYKTEANPSNGVGQTVATQVGSNAVQNHHGLLIFTFKTSF